jgi:hypothetical protein
VNVTDKVGVTFVNEVISRGSLNGVVNLTLGTYNWSVDETDKENLVVVPDLVISARLRMDVICAQRLFESLGTLLQAIEQERVAATQHPTDGMAVGKPN